MCPVKVSSKTPLVAPPQSSHSLWQPKLMYLVSNAWTSAQMNYLTIFYQQTAQFSKMQIGVLQTLPCVCTLVAPPLWGAVADHIQNQRFIHILCIITGALLMYASQFVYWSFNWMVLFVILSNFQVAPTGSLLDHTVLNLLDKVGGEYGKQRLFGALGFGAGAYITGLVVAVAGISWSFNLSLGLGLTSLLVIRTIPPLEDNHFLEDVELDGGAMKNPTFLDNIRLIYGKADVVVLFCVVFFMGIMYGVLSSFLTLNLYNLSGNDAQIVGIAIMCETASELPAFFYSHRIINHCGIVNVLLLSIFGYFLRVSYCAIMTNAWTAIPFEFLHGVTYGLAWAVCTQYVYSAAPPGCEGTIMGVLNAVQNGLARGVGTLIGGYFYQNYGARVMWLVADLGVPLSLFGLLVFARLKKKTKAAVETYLEEAEIFSPHPGNPQALMPHASQRFDEIH
ncbi:major facilitator superfamily [Plasmopara halstedii]|uniref:Major facilitator superfamily n=1 Tax=Plasmopara halstedii TaxID=4781 RepID=A0A0N7L7S4_PLAHL|nr:major facilitator superfamily [Plasmopara halstedii]CEG47883.1 major facilitator superfamily [Plasmopara halstedii]|eukprot:XP_024584252.1 major facilitator superfamily [Plasmopara halstedii]